MYRRHILKSLAAGSALGALGLTAGCASPGSGKGPKVVVVGGGYGGGMASNNVGGIPSLLQNTGSGILPYIGSR